MEQKKFYDDVNLSEDEAKMEVEVEERKRIEDAMKPLAADEFEDENSVSGSSSGGQDKS